ncbi:uncharacterized protein LOC128669304 [Plodia interpunctella]|uniref:uncharacterized protein LOC128669304 n=1 Tax=Plodia interpunctella TaxID=58824 RepID=UPI002367B9F9|nr:uncharacterized protein LOC128669304 [Plodia interpunctella]
METGGLMNTLGKRGKRVTSTYAEVYYDDDYCDYQKPLTELKGDVYKVPSKEKYANDELWKSPSDLLIGILELLPPFTSKITRGITHQGILGIGDDVLQAEQAKFYARVKQLVYDNNAAWEFILDYEKKKINDRVKKIYDKIFSIKSKIMIDECYAFYENSLKELEEHLKSEIKPVLISTHSNIISDLNPKIRFQLEREKNILETILKKRYQCEVDKITLYYQLLLKNEKNRINKFINQALHERNDALQAFVRQVDQENITSTMYVMCTERKKCRMNKFILDNYQTAEISEKLKIIKDKQAIIDDFKSKDVKICCINKDWEEKIRKVLQLFLKFISFSLKLLPEQTTFLLDLERMVVLQLNELQKLPPKAPTILVEENIFKFEKVEPSQVPCDKEPFVIVGDTADSIPTSYGSTETIPSHVDLHYVRLDRQFIYAKCHKFEEVKAFLKSKTCECRAPREKDENAFEEKPFQPPFDAQNTTKTTEPSELSSESSFQRILIDDYKRSDQCPASQCQDWIKKLPFPNLDNYLNYTEENLNRLKIIIGKLEEKIVIPELISAKDIVFKEVPYSKTKELNKNVETQYSSQEELDINVECDCCADDSNTKYSNTKIQATEKTQKFVNEIIAKRQISLRILIKDHPSLLKLFTDESFDFCL